MDAADYVVWRKNPASIRRRSGRLQHMVRQTWAKSSPGAGGSGAVPEPTAICLAMIGLAASASSAAALPEAWHHISSSERARGVINQPLAFSAFVRSYGFKRRSRRLRQLHSLRP